MGVYTREEAFKVGRALQELDYVCCEDPIPTDNVGGITGGMKIARLAESFGMECAPHNWGEAFAHAVHFHCELAMPNNIWFEMTVPQGSSDRAYMKDKFRVARDGYVYASAKPGLGVGLDRAVLDRMTAKIDR